MDRTKIKKEIIEIASNYKNVLEKAGIPVVHLLLFGSYAKGNARLDSDIDIAVISDSFGKDEIEESGKLQFLKWKLDNRIEPHPVSLKDYKSIANPFISEIYKYGIEV